MSREHFATIVIDTEETEQGLMYHARFVTKAIPVVEATSRFLYNVVDTVVMDAKTNLATEMIRKSREEPVQAKYAYCETGRFGR